MSNTSPVPPPPPQGPAEAPKPRGLSRRIVSIAAFVVVFLIGVGIGAAGGNDAAADESAATISSIEHRLDTALTERDELTEQLEDVQTQRNNLADRLDEARSAAKDRAAELDQREAKLDQRATKLDEREAAVTETEQEIENSTFGDGIYVVGEDIAAGEYKTSGEDGTNPVGCYYAFKSGTGADADIIDNNIVEGQARVTLADGEVFESTSCGEWTPVQ